MTKVKVGMDDPSSVEFVERRRAALERYGSLHLSGCGVSRQLCFLILFLHLCVLQVSSESRVSPFVNTRSRRP